MKINRKYLFRTLVLGGIVGVLAVKAIRAPTATEQAEQAYEKSLEQYNKDLKDGNRLQGLFLIDHTTQEIVSIQNRQQVHSYTDALYVNGKDTSSITVLGGTPFFTRELFHNAAEGALLDTNVTKKTDIEGFTTIARGEKALAKFGTEKPGDKKITIGSDYSIKVLSQKEIRDYIKAGYKLETGKAYGTLTKLQPEPPPSQ